MKLSEADNIPTSPWGPQLQIYMLSFRDPGWIQIGAGSQQSHLTHSQVDKNTHEYDTKPVRKDPPCEPAPSQQPISTGGSVQ